MLPLIDFNSKHVKVNDECQSAATGETYSIAILECLALLPCCDVSPLVPSRVLASIESYRLSERSIFGRHADFDKQA